MNTFTIITTSPNKLMEEIHNRMPVILTNKLELIIRLHPENLIASHTDNRNIEELVDMAKTKKNSIANFKLDFIKRKSNELYR